MDPGQRGNLLERDLVLNLFAQVLVGDELIGVVSERKVGR